MLIVNQACFHVYTDEELKQWNIVFHLDCFLPLSGSFEWKLELRYGLFFLSSLISAVMSNVLRSLH